MSKTITIQPEPYIDNVWVGKGGTIAEGKKLPYPFHISECGDVQDQDFWRGDPAAIIGFQNDREKQQVDLWWRDVVADPQLAVGKYPVFREEHKGKTGFYTYTLAIESVTVTEKG